MERLKIRHGIAAGIIFSAGLAIGSLVMLDLIITDHPTIVVESKWKTITTVPTTCPALGHTSLNPDELKTLVNLESQPPPSVPPTTQSTSAPNPPVKPTDRKG